MVVIEHSLLRKVSPTPFIFNMPGEHTLFCGHTSLPHADLPTPFCPHCQSPRHPPLQPTATPAATLAATPAAIPSASSTPAPPQPSTAPTESGPAFMVPGRSGATTTTPVFQAHRLPPRNDHGRSVATMVPIASATASQPTIYTGYGSNYRQNRIDQNQQERAQSLLPAVANVTPATYTLEVSFYWKQWATSKTAYFEEKHLTYTVPLSNNPRTWEQTFKQIVAPITTQQTFTFEAWHNFVNNPLSWVFATEKPKGAKAVIIPP